MSKNKLIYGAIAFIVLIIILIIVIPNRSNNNEDNISDGLRINNNNRLAVHAQGIDNEDILTAEITIENITDEDIIYSIKWDGVVNEFINQQDLTYTITATSEDIRSIGTSQIPVVNIVILEDITIPAGETHTYNVVVSYNRSSNSEDNAESSFNGYLVVTQR